ncbi:hypothetical protein ACIP9C_15540 [Lysinibacillus sp. NPDC093210]|uniref:hypothetical protein n=1 Tax=Lysinibacillus sp. NPDC093210 TaxID=3364133 RepID=UPI003816792B
MKQLIKFFFYSFYLLAAELPLIFILLLRAKANDSSLEFFLKITLLISVAINILLILLLIFWKHHKKFTEDININCEELGKNTMGDFFAFFLLPFFTFSLSTTENLSYLIVELAVLFILLNIFLYRTENLTSNILVYLFFNIYNTSTLGKSNLVLLTFRPLDIQDFDKSSNIIEINNKFIIYVGELETYFRKILLFILSVLGLLFVFIYYYL